MRRRSSGLWTVAFVGVLWTQTGCGSADFAIDEQPAEDAGDDVSTDGAIVDGDRDTTVVPDTAPPPDTSVDDVVPDGAGDVIAVDARDAASDGGVDGVVADTTDAGCSTPTACYGGAASELTGATTACKAGTSYCLGGSLGPCIGEVRPTAESCNGVDDDCNGLPDDGLGSITCGTGVCINTVAACVSGVAGTCTPKPPTSSGETCGDALDNNCNGLVDEGCGCVYVSLSGNDTTGTGSSTLPFRTISKAIASAGTGALPKQVCVGGNTGCSGSPSSASYVESITMRDGISVYGGYNPTGVTWVRAAGCNTTIVDNDHNGVTFPVSVVSTTILDGFSVAGQNNPTSAAITVTGSTGAVISNDVIGGAAGTDSVGILVQDAAGTKATPIIRDCAISGGTGSGSSIGIRSVNSAPVITRNCSSFDTAGRCTSYGCFAATRFIRGRTSGGTSGASTQTYAVKLEGSANAIVDTSALCSSDAPGDVAGLRISGPSNGVLIRQNQIVAPGGATGNVNGVGVWLDPCGGASPWILDNSMISGQSRTAGGRGDGIRAIGDCHPRIDSNQRIVGGEESSANDAIGIYCARDATTGIASRCTILGNPQIVGSLAGFPPNSTGVKCDAGACARIERNIISGNQGINTFGVVLNGASTFVDRNVIAAGCTRAQGIGLLSIDSSARVQNNVIAGGGSCTTATGASVPTSVYAVRVFLSPGLNELDLHSNDLLGNGASGSGVTCTSRALAFDIVSTFGPGSGRGMVRNNILHAGLCPTAYGVEEASPAADPRLLLNNDFWYGATPTVLYRDESFRDLTTIATVNALADITSAANISADPLFVSASNFHLQSGSPCRNTGTNTGAPVTDVDGDGRPLETTSDIGADEYKP